MQVHGHRVVVLVSIKGLRSDGELFEEVCAQRGWGILDQPSHPAGRQQRVVQYTVEIRAEGPYSLAVTAARGYVEEAARHLHLDLHVRAAEYLEADSRGRTLWSAYVELPAAAPPYIPALVWDRVRRTAVAVGFCDTGRQVRAATEAEALRLARRPLPGADRATPGIRVRRRRGDAQDPGAMKFAEGLDRLRLAYLVLVVSVSSGALRFGVQQGLVIPTVAAVLALIATAAYPPYLGRLRRRAGNEGGYIWPFWAWAVLAGSLLGPALPLVAAAGLLFLRGIRLFIRQATWRTWVPAALLLLVPVAVGVLPGMGSWVHGRYLDEFGVEQSDVSLPVLSRLWALLPWTVLVVVGLAGFAVYGLVMDSQLSPDQRLAISVVIAGAVLAFGLAAGRAVVLGPAKDAGIDARRKAAYGDTLSSYYGIEPRWVCVSPLAGVKPDEIPVQGGKFTPTRPYIMLGDSDGTAVLWEPGSKTSPDHGHALKLPLAQLRIAPTTHPDRRCA